MPTSILEVKLGTPYGMPARRLVLLLQQVRRDCRKARNAAITHWLLWRRGHPEWEPGGAYVAPPRKIARAAKPAASGKAAKDPPYAPRAFLSRELYGVAAAAAPMLNTSVCSSCVQEVNARLRANMPYDHDGQARWVWQAVLASEVSLPTWRGGGRIPLPRSVSKLVYTDDRCDLRIPLLSRQAGYKTLSPTVRLLSADLSAGRRRILKQLASGDLRLADSQIVEKKGRWYVQLCYQSPDGTGGLPTERVLTIGPAPSDSPRPLVAHWTDDDDVERSWGMGNGKPLVAEYRRVQARRRAIRHRYSDGCGSGHGRQRWYKAIKPMSRYVPDLSSRFVKQTVSDVVRLAIREGCGTVLYREPTMPVRNCSWFATQDVPMNWVDFEARLAHKCQVSGLEYDKQRIGMGEWRSRDSGERNAM